MTYRYVVYDLQKNFNATFDDADFTFNQILYWVMVVANRLRVQQTMATNSDLFTSTFDDVPVLTDSKGRKYIDLPVQIMDLPNNAGVAVAISGSSVTYAGGGGGGTDFGTKGTGGAGGGGDGGIGGTSAVAGSANTGGGGGGASGNTAFAGGSGIVIIRYAI